ncbi:hypothetical protein ABZY58_11110 [Micromonospora tulbaghiae]|uniref:hypothetical protein n=1 Tax=Micromonospora tulbaghiae TaxID=479978 RepID=UPI0033B05103
MVERTARRDSVYVRGPVHEKQPAQQVLGAAGWRIGEFVVACLRALLADPGRMLSALESHRPARSRPGRQAAPRR